MVHNIESVYRQSILSIQYNGQQSDFWLMSHLPLSCNKRTNKIQKEEKKQILAKTSLQTGKNLTSFQILKMLNGFWQSKENFLENLFY